MRIQQKEHIDQNPQQGTKKMNQKDDFQTSRDRPFTVALPTC
jgi:hypothetical protein